MKENIFHTRANRWRRADQIGRLAYPATNFVNWVPDLEKIKSENKLDGLTDQQWSWLQSIAGTKETLLFLHAPIVGHGGKGCVVNHRTDIVNWVNQPEVNVEGVFCGHIHQNWGFYNVDPNTIENPDEITSIRTKPTDLTAIWFKHDTYTYYAPVYIETENST